eukprot:m.72815 g.72815  ORF g.72815 m.72815 type:complete len:303 (+) comp8803_c0_seq1:1330-2238(+)
MVWSNYNCSTHSTHVIVCMVNGIRVEYTHEEGLEESCEEVLEPGSSDFIGYLFAALICIVFAGAMSGLTVGLMSFDEKSLSVLMTQSKNDRERFHARRVLSLIQNHHGLLVTLLFWNAAAFESLPIFLDKLVPSWAAIVISVTLILIFGEIVPQAICTGPRKLLIGSYSYWLVWTLIVVTYPVAWVFVKALDLTVGHSGLSGSKFMYVPRSTLGLVEDPNAMALVELHGIDEELSPPSPISPTGISNRTNSMSSQRDVLPPVIVNGNEASNGNGTEAPSESIDSKLVLNGEDDGEVDDDSAA